MQQLLAIETSSEACSVALDWDGLIFARHEQVPMQHAELLLPWVRELLHEAGAELSELDGIVFGRGPGSFTSLRIGIGAVQGLAWGAGLPVIPVSSLAAVAQQIDAEPGQFIQVAMDARMGEVFEGGFSRNANGDLVAETAERVCAPGQLCVTDIAQTILAGSAFGRFEQLETMTGQALQVHAGLMPSATALLSLASQWLKENQPLPAAMAQAVYLRDKVAEKTADR